MIYGLIDPRDGQLRYVGRSRSSPVQRLASHCAPSSRRQSAPVGRWLADLHAAGAKPEIEVLDAQPADDNNAEQFWIGYYRALGCNLTNVSSGGATGGIGVRCSEEKRRKIGNAHRGMAKPSLRHQRPSEVGMKISAAKRGTPNLKLLGRKRPPHVVAKIVAANTGQRRSDEQRRTIARAHGGKPFVDQHGIRYEIINEAGRQLGVSGSSVWKVLRGLRRSVKGYVFRYVES